MSSVDELRILSSELQSLQSERQKRLRAKNDLLTYASIIDIPTSPESANESEKEQFLPRHHAFGKHHLLWMDCLQKVEDGKIKRLMGLWPPGAGKSIFSSIVFPTHYLGRFPNKATIVASYGSDLPKKFGRRARSVVRQPIYKRIFGNDLSQESQAVDEWTLTNGSEWMAMGILAGITGNRVDGVIWDDLIKGRQEADSPTTRDKTWEAYMNDLMTRKKPGGWEVGIGCLTADTPVMMGNGTRKSLGDVREGDVVLSFKDGNIVNRKVMKWIPQGEDDIFEVKTGGSIIKGNARHPFLVMRDTTCGSKYWCEPDYSKLEWVRLSDLKVGDVVVTQAFSPENNSNSKSLDIKEAWLLGYMFGDGWITIRDTVQTDRKGRGPYPRRGFVTSVAIGADGFENEKVAHLFEIIFGIRPKPTKYQTWVTEIARVGRWFLDKGLKGRAKTKRLPEYLFSEPEEVRLSFLNGFVHADGCFGKRGRISLSSCNPELMMDLKVLARGLGYRVTNIYIKQKWMQAPSSPKPTFSTACDLQFDPERVETNFFGRAITSIKPMGRAEVFDLQIEDTECFIADGIVVHNTRWHEDDPMGRILPRNYSGESGWMKGQDQNDWFVVCLPAIAERDDDILGRAKGEILWPEWFTEGHFAAFRHQARTWSALFQQRPAPETGDFFQADWFKEYGPETSTPLPHRSTMHIYGASDYAVTDDGGNFTVHIVAGVDPQHNIYILDLWRGKASSDKWVEVFCDLVQKWKPLGWAEESGQIRAGVGPFINKRLAERQLYIARKLFPTRGDKSIRAQSIRGRMAMGKVFWPAGTNWYSEARHEFLTFPAGKTDDIVDACGLLGQVLDLMVSGHPYEPDKDNRPKILSTDPRECNVTLNDVFEHNEDKHEKIKTMKRMRIY